MNLATQNFAIYALQVAILVAIGGALPFLVRLASVRARLAWMQALLAACLLLPLVQPWKHTLVDADISITTGPMTIAQAPLAHAGWQVPWQMLLLAVLAAGSAARLFWLALGFRRLRQYLDRATLYHCPLARSMEVHAYVGLSDEVASPVTFGWRQPVILFPARFAEMEPAMQESIACHELLHVQRRDWIVAVLEEFVRAVFWFHPAVWWLLGEIHLTREQVVDREVVRLTRARQPYLNALVAIASTRARLDLAPAPLFLRKRHLSQRVSQILKEVAMSRTRIAATLTGIGTILLVSGWVIVHSFPLQAAPLQRAVTRSDAPGVTVEQAEANLLHRAPVDYPQEARLKGIQGTVVLEVEIDENGDVSDARVLSGPQELRKAALQSVLQWHYSKEMSLPAKTQVGVDFKLPLSDTAAAAPKPVRPAGPASGSPAIPRPVDSGPAPVLRSIDLSSLPESLQKELRDRIGKYEGQPLTRDVMPEMLRAIAAVDSHLGISLLPEPKGAEGNSTATLRVMLNTTAPTAAIWSKDAPATSAADTGTPPQRIRVGGNVQQTMLVSQARPVYPPEAKQARIQGVVRLNAVIAKDGTVSDLTVVSGHPLLVESALEAVKQWVYKPTLLNGQPVEVQTMIDVNYTLTR